MTDRQVRGKIEKQYLIISKSTVTICETCPPFHAYVLYYINKPNAQRKPTKKGLLLAFNHQQRKQNITERSKAEEERGVKVGLHMGITKVVYYMDPLMSKELLPDKSSAFGFNYSQSQSSIWSPLVPRLHSAIDLDFEYFGFVTPKRQSLGSKSKINKVTSNIKKKLKVAANLVKSKAKHNNNNIKTKASEFYPSPLKPTTKVFLFLFVS